MTHNGTVHQSKQWHTDVADDCRKGEAEYALMDIFLFHVLSDGKFEYLVLLVEQGRGSVVVIGVECGVLAHHGLFDGELDGIANGRAWQTLSADTHVWSYLIM